MLTRFLVHTDVLAREMDELAFTTTVPHMLYEAKCGKVSLKLAYICNYSICHCVKQRKMMCEFDGPDEDTLRSALTKIGLPVTAIVTRI